MKPQDTVQTCDVDLEIFKELCLGDLNIFRNVTFPPVFFKNGSEKENKKSMIPMTIDILLKMKCKVSLIKTKLILEGVIYSSIVLYWMLKMDNDSVRQDKLCLCFCKWPKASGIHQYKPLSLMVECCEDLITQSSWKAPNPPCDCLNSIEKLRKQQCFSELIIVCVFVYKNMRDCPEGQIRSGVICCGY